MVPYAYAKRGGDVVINVPAGGGRMLTKWYHTQLVTEVAKRDGEIVGQHYMTKIDAKPYQVTEGVWNSKLNLAPISQIRVLHNTYDWNHIYRRVRKLGYLIERNDYDFAREGQWDVYSSKRLCRNTGSVSVYYPHAFTRQVSSSGTKISTSTSPDKVSVSNPDKPELPGNEDLKDWLPENISSSSGGNVEWKGNKSQTKPEEIQTPTFTQVQQQPQPSTPQLEGGSTSTSQKKGDVVYVRSWFSTGTFDYNRVYYKWNYETNSWDKSDKYDESYKGVIQSVDESDLGRIGKEIKAEREAELAAQRQAASTQYNSQPSSGNDYGYQNYTSSGGGGIIYGYQNTGNSTISWESGQTSQTVSTSTGIHTIYR